MNLLYNTTICAAPFFIRISGLFNRKLKLFSDGRKGLIARMRSGYAQKCAEDVSGERGRVIWFHCSSVGEFEQARPVIEWYRGNRLSYRILLTFFSPSGYELRKNYPLADWVYYLPMDTPSNARKFMEIFKPCKVIFTKYDLWYNYIAEAKRSGAELYLISAIFRKEQAFFKWYGGFFRRMLKAFTGIFVQDDRSAALLESIGISERVYLSGDTRFDRVHKIALTARDFPVIESFVKGSFSLVAGSSWLPDEEIIAEVMKNFSKVKLVIAPHETDRERIDKVAEVFDSYGVLKYSELAPAMEQELLSESPRSLTEGKRVLIIDSIGLLSSLYKYADFSYIGGGFGVGIHNTLEAAVYGCPLAFGPNYRRFKEAADLIEADGATSVNSASEFYQVLDNCVKDKDLREYKGQACKAYVERNLGATEKIVSRIETD